MTIVYIETLGDDAPARIWRSKRYVQQWLTPETKAHLAGRVGGLFEAELLENVWHIGSPYLTSSAHQRSMIANASIPSPQPRLVKTAA